MSIIFLSGRCDHNYDTVRDSAVNVGELIWYLLQFQKRLVTFNDAVQPLYAFVIGSARCVLYDSNRIIDPVGELGK